VPGGKPSSAEPRAEAERLVEEGLAVAERMLRERGELVPFGYVRAPDGSTRPVVASDLDDGQESSAVVELLTLGLRKGAEAGDYTAAAIFVDVRITPPGSSTETDAVLVEIEHRSGYCADIVFPYQRAGDDKIRFGEDRILSTQP